MEKLTDEEILGMITLLSSSLDRAVREGMSIDEVAVYHEAGPSSDEAMMPIRPLLTKLLKEGVDRGIVRVPPCFKGEF